MSATGGMLTKDDLARYAPRVLPALTGTYRGPELAFSPGAAGGTTAVEMLKIVAQVANARTTRTAPRALHLRTEAIGRALRDRVGRSGEAQRGKGRRGA